MIRSSSSALPLPRPTPRQSPHVLLDRPGPFRSGGARPRRSGNRGPERQDISLTSRETETLELLADGLSNKQIARALRISTHGAKRLVGAVLLKLGAPNRTAAVAIAMHAGLVGARSGTGAALPSSLVL
ncbi:LuxR C-terminal-related transcriptional regulator [Streptomyces sp. DG2A-72]|uniref:response regulator transcription factor n=1 Tax=Streptomyces sp. DG2A-72 TaxID=3051386 RepID=UPI00265C81A0|nr:LuxR C-terminal-related transcriptional regulator [Streptomyces sp. DG2A-72]MDO0930293.1 LuxR C-terminal-related transcriptional regulator [Streptomyces sp. DG2A-72]